MKKYDERTENEVMGVIRLWIGKSTHEHYRLEDMAGALAYAKDYWPDMDDKYLAFHIFLAVNEIRKNEKDKTEMTDLALIIVNKWEELYRTATYYQTLK